MKIILNNRNEGFNTDVLTVESLLKIKNYTFKMLVIKINGVLIKKDKYTETEIKEGDNVTVLHMISGG